MTQAPRAVTIVGASLAGLNAAEALRREGFDGPVTLIGAENHLPYDRPPCPSRCWRAIGSPSGLR